MSKSFLVSQKMIGLLTPYVPFALAEAKTIQSKTGLTLGQLRVIMAVLFGINRVGKLAEMQAVSQPAMSKSVDSLVEEGFLERVTHPIDRRQIELQLTQKSRTTITMVKNTVLKKLSHRLSELSGSDLKRLEAGIDVVASLLHQPEGRSS